MGLHIFKLGIIKVATIKNLTFLPSTMKMQLTNCKTLTVKMQVDKL